MPTSRGSRWVPPKPGMMPRLISGWPKLADCAAIRTSQPIASSQPPPKASALIAAIVTVEDCSMRRSRPCASSSMAAPDVASSFVNALMSAPAHHNMGFAEAMMSARIASSTSTWSHTRVSSSMTCGDSEFAGGRSSQAIA